MIIYAFLGQHTRCFLYFFHDVTFNIVLYTTFLYVMTDVRLDLGSNPAKKLNIIKKIFCIKIEPFHLDKINLTNKKTLKLDFTFS